MKFKILTISTLLLASYYLVAQSCLPDGITFETQSQIDSFQINYPGCTEIEGDVAIGGGYPCQTDIADLSGLNMITSIGGSLLIGTLEGIGYPPSGNPDLYTLTGLENLVYIGGDFIIADNVSLQDLSGLENLSFIGGDLGIGYWGVYGGTRAGNTSLSDITALTGLSIVGNLTIFFNPALSSLSGLNGLTTIEESLVIRGNGLNDLTGLVNLTSIGGELRLYESNLASMEGMENLQIVNTISIYDNGQLNSLSGIDNIDPGSVNEISINSNPELSQCDVQSVCDYLLSPNGPVHIYSNATGCNNPSEIASQCGTTLPCLPYGNYYLKTQAEVDNFQYLYAGCSDLRGDVFIGGADITNLEGLSVINSVSGGLGVGVVSFGLGGNSPNPLLESLSGLDSLSSVGENVRLRHNSMLSDISGLGQLVEIGGFLEISYNDTLASLTGLDNVTSIGDGLIIRHNDALSSLSGIYNLNLSSIQEMKINNNASLSECEVLSVCEYLAAPSGTVSIFNNAIGCNSPEEVQDSCEAHAGYINIEPNKKDIFLYPNPAHQKLNISAEGYSITEMSIYTLTGQKVFAIRPTSESIDISHIPPGMYIVEVTFEGGKVREKLLVQR